MSFTFFDRVRIRSMGDTLGTITGTSEKYSHDPHEIIDHKYYVKLDPPTTLIYNGYSISKIQSCEITLMIPESNLQKVDE